MPRVTSGSALALGMVPLPQAEGLAPAATTYAARVDGYPSAIPDPLSQLRQPDALWQREPLKGQHPLELALCGLPLGGSYLGRDAIEL